MWRPWAIGIFSQATYMYALLLNSETLLRNIKRFENGIIRFYN